MKKKALLLLLALLLNIQTVAFANNEEPVILTDGDYTITVSDDGTAAITRYMGEATELVIPEKLSGYPVTRICTSSFSYCTNLTTVKLPEGLKKLDKGAFLICNNLSQVFLPATLTWIEGNPFNGPSAVKLEVDSGNPVLAIKDGVLFDVKEHRLLCYPLDRNESVYILPDDTEVIAPMAFCGCKSLRQVVLPNGLREIGDLAFNMCDGLESLTIPDTVTSLGANPFAYCQSLTELVIGSENPIYQIQDGVVFTKDGTLLISYLWTKSDLSYAIPSGVKRIGAHAFRMNKTIQKVSVPEGVSEIGMMAFAFCSSLQEVHLPLSLEILDGTSIFASCTELSAFAPQNSIASAYCIANGIDCIEY